MTEFGLDLCHKCTLKDRPSVFGQAGSQHNIILIGEAPGYDEVREGKPFVGKAGQLLNRIFSDLGVDRQTLNISNSCLCQPRATLWLYRRADPAACVAR